MDENRELKKKVMELEMQVATLLEKWKVENKGILEQLDDARLNLMLAEEVS